MVETCKDCGTELTSVYGDGAEAHSAACRNRYRVKGEALGKLLGEKRAAYGDAYGKSGAILAMLYPDGIPVSAMTDALGLVRIIDKMFRIANAAGGQDRMGEDPWLDIAGYGLLAAVRMEDAKNKSTVAK